MRRARGRGVSRRGFLKMGGLAGAAVLGGGLVAGCGGGESSGGAVEITLGFIPDEAGGLQTLLDRFNKENKGEIQVKWRQMPASSAEFFEQMQAELQSGRSTMDVIAGDVVWPSAPTNPSELREDRTCVQNSEVFVPTPRFRVRPSTALALSQAPAGRSGVKVG